MSPQPARKPLKPADTSQKGWARWWFAMGCQEETTAKVAEECGLDREHAERVYQEMRKELRSEIEQLRQNIGSQAAQLFRTLKQDAAADWGTRQRAQLELEKLLDLVAVAQTDEGTNDEEVQEAILFHRQLLDAAQPTAGQKLRSQNRLLQLFGYATKRTRRRAEAHRCRPPVVGPRTAPAPSSIPNTPVRHRAPATATEATTPSTEANGSLIEMAPSDPADALAHIPRPVLPMEHAHHEAARRELVTALETESALLDAELERLVAGGMSADEALAKLEPRLQENELRQIALQQAEWHFSPPSAPPEPHATGPPP